MSFQKVLRSAIDCVMMKTELVGGRVGEVSIVRMRRKTSLRRGHLSET